MSFELFSLSLKLSFVKHNGNCMFSVLLCVSESLFSLATFFVMMQPVTQSGLNEIEVNEMIVSQSVLFMGKYKFLNFFSSVKLCNLLKLSASFAWVRTNIFTTI